MKTFAEHHLHVVVLGNINLHFEKMGTLVKNKDKDVYLHSMPVKMAALSVWIEQNIALHFDGLIETF